jgi:ABC-type transport system substrate-binding protein
MRRHRLLLMCLLITALFGMLAVSAAAQEESVLRIVSNFDIRTSDPHVAYETETWPTSALFNLGLVRWSDDNSEIVPALAESYSISDDGLVYTFVLREGLMFADGTPITPEAVKWSFERMQRPETLSPTSYMFGAISGTQAFVDGEAEEITGIQVVDDRTVTFTLDVPVYSLIQRFALPPGFIVPQSGVEAAGDNFARQPMGAGPFVLESWEPGVRISGTRNPNYYLPDRPVFDRFEMTLGVEPSVGILRMEAGEADIALDWVPSSEYPRISGDPALAQYLLPIAGFPNIDYLVVNHANDNPFGDLNVRQAVSLAVDRSRIIQILSGRAVPAEGPIPPNVLGNNSTMPPLEYNPDAARQLLADAGYADGFTTDIYTNIDPTNITVAQAIISDLAQVGITLNLVSLDNPQFLDMLINDHEVWDIAVTNWYLDYPDPSNIWEPLTQCGGSYNWGQYCNEELDAVFADANNIPPGDERWAAFSDFEAAIVDQMPNVFLHHLINYYFRSSRLNIASDPAILLRWDSASLNP